MRVCVCCNFASISCPAIVSSKWFLMIAFAVSGLSGQGRPLFHFFVCTCHQRGQWHSTRAIRGWRAAHSTTGMASYKIISICSCLFQTNSHSDDAITLSVSRNCHSPFLFCLILFSLQAHVEPMKEDERSRASRLRREARMQRALQARKA